MQTHAMHATTATRFSPRPLEVKLSTPQYLLCALSYQGYFSIQTQTGNLAPTCWGPMAAPVLPVALRRRMSTTYQCALRGRGWQRGQLNDDRFMNESRRMGVPHRLHGCPSRP